MKTLSISLFGLFLFLTSALNAQNNDSTIAVQSMKRLFLVCKNAAAADSKAGESVSFSSCARYVAYNGTDMARAWKDTCNYRNREEKTRVDGFCKTINSGVNLDPAFKVIGYKTKQENEMLWYVIEVSYMKNGVETPATFSFLKIRERFALGEIK